MFYHFDDGVAPCLLWCFDVASTIVKVDVTGPFDLILSCYDGGRRVWWFGYD